MNVTRLMSSGELLMTLREDWLRLRTDSLKFSGLANILGGTLWPAGSAGPRTEAVRGSVLGAWVSVSMKASCAPPHTFLLYSQKNKISRLLMEEAGSQEQVPDIVLPIRKARSIQSVSYDEVAGMVYWVDNGRADQPARQVIRRSTDSGNTEMFDRLDKFQPFDLVIDPITR